MTELAGVFVGDYFLLECLAHEGMAETYRARPTTRGGYDVILRLFRPPFPDVMAFREHFAVEVEKVWHCHHEHIQPLLEFGTGEELLYCASAQSELKTLEHLLRQQQEQMLPVENVVRLIAQLCDALHYAHNQGIVHGNIQPSSILLRENGDALLTNFGMKRAYQQGEPLVAQIEEGNAAYLAPEQALGMVMPASDIYALGILLYRLLGGVLPYDGANAGEIALKHADEPLPSLRAVRPDISETLELVVRVALSKTPSARFPTTAALAQALTEACLPEDSRVVSSIHQTPQVPRRLNIVRAQRTAFSWARVAPLVTTTLLLFALVGASIFVFTLPQLRGQPFWNSIQMAMSGYGHSAKPVGPPTTPHVTPTASSGTTSGTQSTLPTGWNSTVPGQTPAPNDTPGVTPPVVPDATSAPRVCTTGTLTMNGSPYMVPFLQQVNADYQGQCQQIQVRLGDNGSRAALNQLAQNKIDAATSDLTARPARELTDYAVAVMLYAVIVNPNVHISGLSSTNVQAIFQGQITNWSQVGGPNLPINVFLRPPDDTATTILRAFMLNGMPEHVKGMRLKQSWASAVALTPGAIGYVPLAEAQGANVVILPIDGMVPNAQNVIQGSYQFWGVEHLYTQGDGTQLFQNYLAFLESEPETAEMSQFGLVPIAQMPSTILASHVPGPEI